LIPRLNFRVRITCGKQSRPIALRRRAGARCLVACGVHPCSSLPLTALPFACRSMDKLGERSSCPAVSRSYSSTRARLCAISLYPRDPLCFPSTLRTRLAHHTSLPRVHRSLLSTPCLGAWLSSTIGSVEARAARKGRGWPLEPGPWGVGRRGALAGAAWRSLFAGMVLGAVVAPVPGAALVGSRFSSLLP
jgi:hypothetical protein